MTDKRFSTGLPALDGMLGGGLLPGRLAVVLGATGIGKTQLGVQFANAGRSQEQEPGIFFDLTSRGDSQSHADYASRIADWLLREFEGDAPTQPADVFDRDLSRFDIAHLFRRSGKRVTKQDLDQDEYREWKQELNRKLAATIRFFYGNLVHGVRRIVIDGVEPSDSASESFQFNLFEYIQNQILSKESEWLARDHFRVHFRANEQLVHDHTWQPDDLCSVLLATSHEVMLDDLLARPIESGDVMSNANTIILMGKFRDGMQMKRALCVAKHRGSRCDETIVPFEITEHGLQLQM